LPSRALPRRSFNVDAVVSVDRVVARPRGGWTVARSARADRGAHMSDMAEKNSGIGGATVA
jgi:hypothetical protein